MSEMVDAIKGLFWSEMGKIHTAIPGQVESYDEKKVRVEVKPMVGRRYVDEGPKEFPRIASVPVVFPRSGDAHITFPLNRGDGVLLIFTERSLEEWLSSGNSSIPNNTRKFSLTDAVAIPGLFAFGKGSKIDSKNELEIRYKNVKIASDGADVNIQAGSVALSVLDGVVTGRSICAFTGAPHPDKSSTVRASH